MMKLEDCDLVAHASQLSTERETGFHGREFQASPGHRVRSWLQTRERARRRGKRPPTALEVRGSTAWHLEASLGCVRPGLKGKKVFVPALGVHE